MSRTLAESRHDVEGLLRHHAGLVVDPVVINNWLAQGQQDIAMYSLCVQEVATFTDSDSPVALVEGQRSYDPTLPAGSGGLGLEDFQQVLHAKMNGVPLLLWTPDMVRATDPRLMTGGTPRYYYEFADYLMLVPYPDRAFLQQTFRFEVTYAAVPAEWTGDSTASALPAGFEDLPVLFAASRVAIMRRRWPLAADWHAQYLTGLVLLQQQSLMQRATSQREREMPVHEERSDEPRRPKLLADLRQQQRRTARG